MADLTITATSVVPSGGARIENGYAGAAVTAGQVVYLDTATGTYKLADNDSGTAAVRSPRGIALHAAAIGQPLAVQTSGRITIGATTAIGVIYCLSSTAGGICPSTDNATGDYVTVLGVGVSTTQIDLKIQEAGAVMA